MRVRRFTPQTKLRKARTYILCRALFQPLLIRKPRKVKQKCWETPWNAVAMPALSTTRGFVMFQNSNFIRHSLLACLASASLVAVAQTAAPTTPSATPKAAAAGTDPKPAAAPSAKDKAGMEVAFSRADTNGDGKLSKEEAARMPAIAAKFEDLDANKDGSLTMDEFSVGYMAAAN
jgi:EF hand